MFWADRVIDKIEKGIKREADKSELVVRDEKTASGRVHVGSMRGVVVHGIISRILEERGFQNKFYFEINDFDPMDDLPPYLDQDEYSKYLGFPLYLIPSPDKKAQNFAEFYAGEFIDVIEGAGFHPEYYRASDLYKSGKMNETISLALNNAVKIRDIYKAMSGSEKPEDWLPLSVVCEECGRISTTKAIGFDGELVTYVCQKNALDWVAGCGHEGKVSPFDGNAKLAWKVEWAAKFKVMNVDIEGAGKDHSTKGGSRDIASRIAKEVFDYKDPFNIPYEFFLIGGKKMSSSKGHGSSAREIADLLPPEIFRLALLGKDAKQAINFDPEGDTIPVLFDQYDRLAEEYFNNAENDSSRLFSLIHTKETAGGLEKRFLPRFSMIVFLAQMPHMDIYEELKKVKESELTDADKQEIDTRVKYAKIWIDTYAPDDYKFEIQETIPVEATKFTGMQKAAIKKVAEYLEANENPDGQELHTFLHDTRKEIEIDPKDFFGAIYMSILGKESGPKAGWFLSVLDRQFLIDRFNEIST